MDSIRAVGKVERLREYLERVLGLEEGCRMSKKEEKKVSKARKSAWAKWAVETLAAESRLLALLMARAEVDMEIRRMSKGLARGL